ncbi:hypothetical protein [Amycolatopsis sp. NPDC051128]|uniref:hypothetical protein n=1 Tax=Amycolatopsis sp. NPDC051128 TaxID=3155412 RepID=UPI00341B6266
MTFPAVPEDVAAEIFVTTAATGVTAWTSISKDIRLAQGSAITVSGGYSSVTRSPTPAPSQCEFTINNRSGNYSPKNPLGAFYGSIGQNTPIRLASRVAKSSFSGTASNGWALPERGGAWTVTGTASRYSEGSGAGSMSFTAAAQTLMAYQAGQLYRDIEVAASFTYPFSNITGGNLACGIVLNGISTTDYFVARLNIDTSEAMTLDVVHVTASTIDNVVPAVAVSSFAYTGQKIRIKAQLSGQQLRAKVWPAASPEPYAWLVDGSYVEGTTEGTPYADRGKGWVGIYAATGTGQTNVTFALAVDDFEARINQFHGEATSWPTEWDVSGRDVYGRVEAAGLRRRLSQGAAILPSTYTRANVNTSPAHLLYYPVEDGTQAGSIASGFPDAAPMTIYGSPQYSSNSDFAPGSAPIARVNNSSWVTPDISVAATGFMQAIFLLSVPSGGETDQVAFVQLRCTGTAEIIDCYWDAAAGSGNGGLRLKFYDRVGTLVHTSVAFGTGLAAGPLKGTPLQVSLEFTQSGSDIAYALAFIKPGDSGGVVTGGTVTGYTFGSPYRLYISPHSDVTNTAIGHVALRNNIISVFTNFGALNAYNGEGLRVRMSRLCSENDGVNFCRTRSTINDQVVLGKQQQATFLTLMDEAAKADMGFLLESRDIVGLVMFTMRALYNRDAFLTLDYAAGQVQPPFKAADDDQLIINDFTASRVDGGSARVTRTTGPLALTSPTSGRGVGRYNDSESYTLPSDIYLPDMASWVVHVGTINESRYPSLNADVSKLARVSTQLYLDLLGVWAGDRVEIAHPKATHIASTISQIVYGYRRTFGGKHHTLELVCAPALPYTVAEMAADTGDTNPWLMRADTDGSTVNTLANAGATSLSVATPSGPLWTTTADDYPLYLDVGGIQVRATACTGSSSPQTFTVDALPVARAAGLSVSVWHLPVLAQ